MKKYALLYFEQINDNFSKWMFPLHDGENIIGSDKDVDIFLYLNEKEDIIDSVHCKIIVNEVQNDVGIINLTSKGYVKRGENDEKITLSPGKEYELNHKSVFYLTDNVRFMLIKGTIDEIHEFFSEENLENEFQKWEQFINEHETNIKVDLNLTRKESCNKSFVSNNNNDNNINLNTSINNNTLINSEKYNNSNIKEINNNISNSIFGSNNKDDKRIDFNNFDEVPDNLISDYKIPQQNPINSALYKNGTNSINTSPFKIIDESPKKEYNKNENNNSINKIQQVNQDNTNNNISINEKETEINSMKSEIKEELILNNNNKYTKEYNGNNYNNYVKPKENYDNSLDLFKQTSTNSEIKKNNSEKVINKDEKTIQTIKELLGENNLEIIIKNTNKKVIKKFDIIWKKGCKGGVGIGNFDIQFKKNDLLSNTIKYEHKNTKNKKF